MSELQLRIFDGTRQPFAAAAQFLVTITDGNKNQQVRQYCDKNDIIFTLPFFDNLGDNYTVLVWADGYKQAGFVPVKLSDKALTVQEVMLIPKDPQFNFATGQWAAAKAEYGFLGSDVDDPAGQSRYDDLMEMEPESLACLLNLTEAMSIIQLDGQTPLDYLKQVRWDGAYAPAQDRFFAWCEAALVDAVRAAAARGEFAVEINPGLFHPGATNSWKQIQFGEANVQLTFHENDRLTINGVDCVMVEPDIDYFQDLGAHVLLEVIPNALTHTLTDPAVVYVLRWIAGQTAGAAEFAPLFVITS